MRSMTSPFAQSPVGGSEPCHHGRFDLVAVASRRRDIRNCLKSDWEENMRFISRVFVFCLAALLSAGLLWGQSFLGSITGAVTASSGAVIPGATVELNSVTTGQQFHAVTNSAGIYLFSNLNPGEYTVTVSKPGFSQVHSGNITLIAAEHTRFDTPLKVGTATQTVNVSTTAPALNTENGLISNSLSTKALLT